MKNTYVCSIYSRGLGFSNQADVISHAQYSKIKKSKVVLVKSPHVHKKSKERFVFTTPNKARFVSKNVFPDKIGLLLFVKNFIKIFPQEACVSYFFKIHVQRVKHLNKINLGFFCF